MATSYRAQVATAFEVLAEGLAPFVDTRMSSAFPGDDWILMAAHKLGKRRDVLVSLSDPHFQLEVMNRWWGPVFAPVLTTDLRQTVTDLRTARNHWAHPDEDHPFDVEYAARVHAAAEDLLRAIDAPEADRLADLAEHLRWTSIRDVAREEGLTEADALMQQLQTLQKQYDELQGQLEDAREVAQSATGRTRAVSRQLAELQSQYAAVAGLRDQYQALQRQLADGHEVDVPPAAELQDELATAEMALVGLQRESEVLRAQLAEARRSMSQVDPVDTEVGRRWIWLVTVLILLLGILVVVAYYSGPR
ncbi:MAG: Swt1 family HEPN domain-containing protein [Acidimicrobiales bacterium]